MKTKNKIISIFTCLCLALLSGCSQDSGGEPAATPAASTANTSAAGNADNGESSSDAVTAENNAADTSSGNMEATEAENRSDNELFAYYDLLNAEYEKCGKLYNINDGVIWTNEKVICGYSYYSREEDHRNIRIYDAEKKAITTDVNIPLLSINHIYYIDNDNGYFYSYTGNYSDYLYSKYDNSGNLIAQIEIDNNYMPILMPDETLFYCSDGVYNMYSSDWQTKTELPVLQAEVEHGIKKDIKDYFIVASYGNKVYVYPKDSGTKGYYCLNTDTMIWGAVESELNEIIIPNYYDDYSFTTEIIGRYLFIRQRDTGKIYDMETDTVIATIPSGFSCYGRNYDLVLKSGVLTKYQYPGDGSEAITETILDTGDTRLNEFYSATFKGRIGPLNEQYYVYVDQYGIFLREYGKGEDGEITVMMLEN